MFEYKQMCHCVCDCVYESRMYEYANAIVIMIGGWAGGQTKVSQVKQEAKQTVNGVRNRAKGV